MRTRARRGTAYSVAALAVVVIIAAGVLAFVYLGGAFGRPTTTKGNQVAAPLISYAADAYAPEVTALLEGFSQGSGLPVAPVKSGGSFADANQIAAGAPDDVFVSVALTAADPAHLKGESPNWAVGFASDQLVLAYANTSSAHEAASQGVSAFESNSSSGWAAFFSNLTSGSVKVGIGDPAEDPAGLRGWLALEVAGYMYGGGNESAYAGRLVRSGGNVTGANAAALVAPLESGEIQFLFIYRSAAMAGHLDYVPLERHVSFGDPSLSSFYSRLSYKDAAGVTSGAPIILCVTVPLGSANTAEALQFVRYVVENAGTLAPLGVQPFSPPRLYNSTAPPALVGSLVSQGEVVLAGPLP